MNTTTINCNYWYTMHACCILHTMNVSHVLKDVILKQNLAYYADVTVLSKFNAVCLFVPSLNHGHNSKKAVSFDAWLFRNC